MTAPCVSIILPVYNEDGNIAACLRDLTRAMQGLDHEILVCYDFDEDTTLPAIAAMEDRPATVKTMRNLLGRGAAFAIRAGFQAAKGDVIVTTMADLSDPPEVIPQMARKIREEGADVVSGSRYMKGGSQTGGPPLKVLLSRAAGLSLRWFAGLGTHDATTNFRAYSRRFIDQVRVESQGGFELALELTVKAHLQGFKVDEVPSTWKDRSAGESRFRLWTWLPRYLLWYLKAAGAPLLVWGVLAAATIAALILAVRGGPVIPYFADEWSFVAVVTGRESVTLDWIFSFHNDHRIPLAKLIWIAVERLSGFDGRWGSVLNAGILAAAAGLLLRGMRALRGRTVWTDAVVPLLLLHGGNAENITWPFQVAFCLVVLLLAWIVSRMLALARRPRDTADPGLAAGIFLLPFCGAPTFPFVVLLAPWTLWISRRDPRPVRRRLAIGFAAGALLLLPFYFGHTSEWAPPSPGFLKDMVMALVLLTGSLGISRSAYWPESGCFAVGILAIATMLLLRRAKIPAAAGLLLVLASLIGLALMIGHARSGLFYYIGTPDRYVTLFCLAPFLAYASLQFLERPVAVRVCQVMFLVLVGLFYLRNGTRADEIVAARRVATEAFLRNVRVALPTSLLARRHATYWSPVYDRRMEKGLVALARDRWAFYRHGPAPLPWTEGSSIALADGRTAVDLSSGAVVHLRAETRGIRLDAGLIHPTTQDVWCTLRLLREGAAPHDLGLMKLGRQTEGFTTAEFPVDGSPGIRLEVTVLPTSAPSDPHPWMIVESR